MKMRLVLEEDDLKRLPAELRNALVEIVFGDAGTGETTNVVGINQSPDTVISAPVALDYTALDVLWKGVNEASRNILSHFAENGGSANTQELMGVIGADKPRQLNGPMGGISRKLRKMFGAEVILWSYDKVGQRYGISEGTYTNLRHYLGAEEAFEEEYQRKIKAGEITPLTKEKLEEFWDKRQEGLVEPPVRKAYEAGEGLKVNPDFVVSRSKKVDG